ncbi:MAG: SPOR domain-containing protein [Salibacter sp.]|uniref:HU domain-containing protein n=1 Tax=Salibacter sp. TaxID=2010995 RepID=UPI00286FC7B3|nr:SPOR domain-containing protein [Salibacter sp.]MDR9399296.1 SPOR domain-containing protein [Salibacter sp.]
MRPVEEHIYNLLFDHDCVVLPGVGGFYTVQSSAKLKSGNHKIDPPGKFVAFNKDLRHNDGLLINTISSSENIDYEKAKQVVQDFAQPLETAIRRREGFALNGLGTVHFNSEGSLQFEADKTVNFDRDSFGLESVIARPVSVKSSSAVESRSEPEPETPRSTSWKRVAAAAVLLPIVGYGAWFLTATDVLKPDYKFHTSDLNPFTDKICEVYHPRSGSVDLSFEEIKSQKNFDDFILVEDGRTIPVADGKPAGSGSDRKTTKNQRGNYHLIVGCFGEKRNAERYMNKLTKLGYDPYIVDVKNGLLRVSAENLTSRSTAEESLSKVKTEVQSGAWLLTK